MVIQYFRQVTNKPQTGELSIKDPHIQIQLFHSLTQSLQIATGASLTLYPLIRTLKTANLLHKKKVPKFNNILRFTTTISLAFFGGQAFQDYQTDPSILQKNAFKMQKDKNLVFLEDLTWSCALAGFMLSCFGRRLSLINWTLAGAGFGTGIGYGLVYGQEFGYVDEKVKKGFEVGRLVGALGLSGGYRVGGEDKED